MERLSGFCTCGDRACPLNPANHQKGCAPCVAKCLAQREIPNCFFHLLDLPGKPAGYTFRDFARLVLEKDGGETGTEP